MLHENRGVITWLISQYMNSNQIIIFVPHIREYRSGFLHKSRTATFCSHNIVYTVCILLRLIVFCATRFYHILQGNRGGRVPASVPVNLPWRIFVDKSYSYSCSLTTTENKTKHVCIFYGFYCEWGITFNCLAPKEYGSNFKCVNSKHTLCINFVSTFCGLLSCECYRTSLMISHYWFR